MAYRRQYKRRYAKKSYRKTYRKKSYRKRKVYRKKFASKSRQSFGAQKLIQQIQNKRSAMLAMPADAISWMKQEFLKSKAVGPSSSVQPNAPASGLVSPPGLGPELASV